MGKKATLKLKASESKERQYLEDIPLYGTLVEFVSRTVMELSCLLKSKLPGNHRKRIIISFGAINSLAEHL